MEGGPTFELNGQPFADILQPDARFPQGLILRDGVLHAQGHHIVRHFHGDSHHDLTLMARQAMHDGVLDQWLQYQTGHPDGGNVFGPGQLHAQAVGKAPLLEFQIQSDELQLVGEAGEVPFAGIEQAAQQIRELHHHGLRGFGVPLDMPADGVQQIEQGVGR